MDTTDDRPDTGFSGIADTIKTYVGLLMEDTRLNLAEKLTRLMSAIAVAALLTVFITAALLFLSIAAGYAIAEWTGPLWAFVIVAAFYVLLIALLLVFRTALIVNPVARFISRLVLPAPQKSERNDKSASVSE